MSIPSEIVAPGVRDVLDELRNRGYVLVREQYDEAAFGNALMVLEGDAARVRLVRDRAQWFVEATPSELDDWFAPVVWHCALVAPVPASETLPFAHQAGLLLGDLDRIETASASNGDELLNRLRSSRERRARARREMPPPG